MGYTDNQIRAMEEPVSNILVSAAAGSGKTSVLVGRIINEITREKDPVDIDRLLVMTFTKSAAAEMKERILRAIHELQRKDRSNTHLNRQAALIHNAQISTIHGFCLNVIRNHFVRIDLSPDFRPVDEAEGKLLEADVLADLLEEAYEEADPGFLAMCEHVASGKSDSGLEDAILKLHSFAISSPDVEGWFQTCLKIYEEADSKTFSNHPLLSRQLADHKRMLNDILPAAKAAQHDCAIPGGAFMYLDAVTGDLETIESLIAAKDYESFRRIVLEYRPIPLGRAKKNDPPVIPEAKDNVKIIRDHCKTELVKLKDYYAQTPEQMAVTMSSCREDVRWLITLTRRFHEGLQEKKKQKSLIDFNDMEHLCLKILTENPEIAAEYRDHYAEIYVDEYQDSNYIQEAIIRAIANDNVFNVGDVKQSIYRFRMARPDLFLEKYKAFGAGKDGLRIDLQENFRSRKEVIDAVNEVFERIMIKELGGISYDKSASLKYGADCYDETPVIKKTGNVPEASNYVNQNDENNPVINAGYGNVTEGSPTAGGVDRTGPTPYVAEFVGIVHDDEIHYKELEAAWIGNRILELIESKLPVYDKQEKTFRPVRYSDIVILLRTTAGWDNCFCNTIGAMGIPIHAASSTGYFNAPEVVTLTSFLRVIDNPLQDIPLASVLLSTIGGFSNEEMAIVRAANKKVRLYQSLCDFRDNATDTVNTGVIEKTAKFLDLLAYYRDKASRTSVYDILEEIIDGDYGRQVLASSAGQKGYANCNMLLQKALDYGKTSYKGLFQFVRYMEYLKKHEIDYGEANLSDEHDNTVRLMTIHKSKGLEFPVVFLSGMSKGMNFRDSGGNLVLDPELGIGIPAIDSSRRTRMQTVLKTSISAKQRMESLAEEIRVLYVAMTRAREKLIMTSVIKKERNPLIGAAHVLRADSFLKLLAAAADDDGLFRHISVRITNVSDLIKERMREELKAGLRKDELLGDLKGLTPPDEDLADRLSFRYDFDPDDTYGKVSVTELKKRSMELEAQEEYEDGERPERIVHEEVVNPLIPAFIRKGEKIVTPTMHGTAFHRMLEIWDYSREGSRASVEAYFDHVRKIKRIEEDLLSTLRPDEIADFLATDLAGRMKAAAGRGELYREQPFVILVGKNLLVQGIIDAFFVEDGQIVIVDYKTDRVPDLETLAKRYHVQLQYYGEALNRLLHLPVKEKLLYSATLRTTIPV